MSWLPPCCAWPTLSCACRTALQVRRQASVRAWPAGGRGGATALPCHSSNASQPVLFAGHSRHRSPRLCACCPAGDRLVPLTAVGAGGGLTAHVSRAKANGLAGAAGRQMPGLGRLAVRHTGCAFLLTSQPSFDLLLNLTALR